MAIADFSNTPFSDLVSLKGRRAVVTGGAHGIGAGIAQRLADAGAAVIIGDLDLDGATETAKSIRNPDGVQAQAFALDVASDASVLSFIDFAVAKMGGIDIWVNNAGIFPFETALDIDMALWDKVQQVNLHGAFFAAREAAKRMIACKSPHGVIVNIASMAGIRGRTNMSAYIASKHGVIGFTKALGLELGPMNIRVLGVAPGIVITRGQGVEEQKQMAVTYPLGRVAFPDDIARVVLFCASDLSAFMTGSVLMVEGGSGAGLFP